MADTDGTSGAKKFHEGIPAETGSFPLKSQSAADLMEKLKRSNQRIGTGEIKMDNGEIKKVSAWDYDLKKFGTICEVLDFAIEREVDAQSFYMKLSKMVKDPDLVKTLIDLAAEELDHETKLNAVRRGETLMYNHDVGDLDIADYTKDVSPGPNMSYTDLLVIGMKKEETSRKLYADLALIIKQQDLKDMFMLLAKQEAEHKLRFELEYDIKAF